MRGGAKKKKKRMESLRLRKTGVKDKHLYGGRGGGGLFPPAGELCLLLVSPLSIQSISHINKKTKQKKLYPPFPVQNQTCSRGTWKEAKMWHSHPYRISRFIIFSLFFSLSWLSWQPPNRLLFSISSSGGARTRWVREVERHVTVSNTL